MKKGKNKRIKKLIKTQKDNLKKINQKIFSQKLQSKQKLISVKENKGKNIKTNKYFM